MFNKSEAIKKIKDRIFLESGLKSSVTSFIYNESTTTHENEELVENFIASFNLIEEKLQEMNNTDGMLEVKYYSCSKITPHKVLLDGVCLTSHSLNSDLYYSCEYLMQDPEVRQYYMSRKQDINEHLLNNIDSQLDCLVNFL
ncbi:hypothetical protein AB837_00500 [bacterium AB1]|nr:hypothetical protein AB837_00500 [bacterium AB1]